MSNPTATGDPFVVPPIKSPYDPTTSGDSDPRIGYPRFRCLLCQRGANDLDAPHYLQRVSSKGKGAVAIWICTEHINPELLTDREKWINLCDKASDNETKAAASETGEWMVHEDGYGILEWHPRHKDGVGMLCRCHDRMEAQYTVDAHNAALATERELHERRKKELDATVSNLEITIEQNCILNQQLAAEREKAENLLVAAFQAEEQLAAERERTDNQERAADYYGKQLADERKLSEQARAAQRHMNACRGLLKVPEGEVLYDAIEELQEQLSAVTVALTKADTQLAAERKKYERSQEKVREYFDLLADERTKHDNTCKWYQKQLAAERGLREKYVESAVAELKRQFREQLAAEREEAQKQLDTCFKHELELDKQLAAERDDFLRQLNAYKELYEPMAKQLAATVEALQTIATMTLDGSAAAIANAALAKAKVSNLNGNFDL